MSQSIDLKDLERRAFRANFQDGLWDIFLGLLLLQMSFGPVSGSSSELSEIAILAFILVYTTIVLGSFWYIKKTIVLPRLGVVKYGPARQKKRKKLSLALALSVLLGVLVFLGAITLYQKGAPQEISGPVLLAALATVFGVTAVIVFSLMAYFMDFPRAYLYGWFYALGVISTFWLLEQGVTFPWIALLLSGTMILIGLTLFVRFLHYHPLPPKETV